MPIKKLLYSTSQLYFISMQLIPARLPPRAERYKLFKTSLNLLFSLSYIKYQKFEVALDGLCFSVVHWPTREPERQRYEINYALT